MLKWTVLSPVRMQMRPIVTLTVNLSNYVRRRSAWSGGDLDRNRRRSIVSMPACDVCVCSVVVCVPGGGVGCEGWVGGWKVRDLGYYLLLSLAYKGAPPPTSTPPPITSHHKITPNHPVVYPAGPYPDCTGLNTGRTGLFVQNLIA